eukprot:14771023-Ditylum_brightwellii.AAC.1
MPQWECRQILEVCWHNWHFAECREEALMNSLLQWIKKVSGQLHGPLKIGRFALKQLGKSCKGNLGLLPHHI